MTGKQKLLILLFVVVDLLVFCGVGVFFLNRTQPGATANPVAAAQVTAPARPSSTNTAEPTAAPKTATIAAKTTPTATEPAATSGPTPTLIKNWTRVDKTTEGFTLALPNTWKSIDMDPQTRDAAIKTLKERNPQLAPMLDGQAGQLATSGVKLWGFDLSPEAIKGGFAPNVNVLREPLNMEVSLDVYAQLNVGQLENAPTILKPVNSNRVDLASGPAQKLEYKMNLNGQAGKPIVMAINQFIVVRGRNAYVVTLSCLSDQLSKYSTVFDQIGRSFAYSGK